MTEEVIEMGVVGVEEVGGVSPGDSRRASRSAALVEAALSARGGCKSCVSAMTTNDEAELGRGRWWEMI